MKKNGNDQTMREGRKVSSTQARRLMTEVLRAVAILDDDPELDREIRQRNTAESQGMHQVPVRMWNQIAQTQELRNPSFQELMMKSQDDVLVELDQQAKILTARGIPDAVISAYQRMAPLLAEHEAISRYIEETGNYDLRNALPEVVNATEAVAIAAADHFLDEREAKQLMAMLVTLELANMRD